MPQQHQPDQEAQSRRSVDDARSRPEVLAAGGLSSAGTLTILTNKVVAVPETILAMGDEPLVLVPGQGAGTLVYPLALIGSSLGTSGYALVGNPSIDTHWPLDCNFGAMQNVFVNPDWTFLIDVPGSGWQSDYDDTFRFDDQPFDLYCPGGNPTDGDLTLTITTAYAVVDIA